MLINRIKTQSLFLLYQLHVCINYNTVTLFTVHMNMDSLQDHSNHSGGGFPIFPDDSSDDFDRLESHRDIISSIQPLQHL